MKKLRQEKSFTLIEILVVIFVLSVGLLGILQAFPLGIRISKASQMATSAIQLSQAKIEEMIALTYDELAVGTVTENYDVIEGYDAYKRATTVACLRLSDLSEVSCVYDLTNDPYPTKKIEVAVYWKIPFSALEQQTKIITLVSKK